MSIYDYSLRQRDGQEIKLAAYQGQVLLIVNTATGCGFTPQYEGLEKLYQKYHAQGLTIIDIPCNQFGQQAPGSDSDIHEFCTFKYHTSFDQFTKADVNGDNELPLYTYLKAQIPADQITGVKNKITMATIAQLSKTTQKDSDIKWNFTKFLVAKDGQVVARYSPTITPAQMEADIQKLLLP